MSFFCEKTGAEIFLADYGMFCRGDVFVMQGNEDSFYCFRINVHSGQFEPHDVIPGLHYVLRNGQGNWDGGGTQTILCDDGDVLGFGAMEEGWYDYAQAADSMKQRSFENWEKISQLGEKEH